MPLYEYECNDCGHRFERIQRFSDPLASTCPACGGAVRKLLSSPAIQFKGTGWYVTDYAKKKPDGARPDSGEDGKKKDAGEKGAGGKGSGAAASGDASSAAPKTEPAASTAKPASDSAATR